MKIGRGMLGKLLSTLLEVDAKRVTHYASEKMVVSAQRVSYGNRIDRRDKRTTVVLKIGAPNHRERKFIRDAVEAGEKFPIRKVQMKYFPASEIKCRVYK